MKIEFEVDTDDTYSLQKLYDMSRALLGITGGAAAPASPPKAAAAASPPKAAAASASTPAAPATPAGVSAVQPNGSATTQPAASGDTVDLPTATAAFQAYVKANGPAKAKAIMAELGYTKLPEIPADQLGAFVARLQAA